MNYKHLVIFASVIFLGIFNITNASLLSDSFIKLLNVQSISSDAHVNYSFKNGLTGGSGGSKKNKGVIDLLLSGNQDISTPNKIIASQDFKVSIESSDFNLNLAISTKMIGDTFYIKIPDVKFDEFIPELVPYKNQWIKISKEDVDYLEPQFPGVKDSYEKAIKVNQEPSVLVGEVSQIIKKYSYAFILKKTGIRVENGVSQDKYTVTFSKKRLANLLIADFTKIYKIKKTKDKKELTDSINETLASVNFRNGILYIGQNDGLPYEISFNVDQLKNKKVISTLKVNLKFSQFGSHFDSVVIAPSSFVTLTNLYDQAFKPIIEKRKSEQKTTISGQETISIEQEEAILVAKIGRLTILPTGETPIVATVSDPEALKDQAFFANAVKGDKVLIYTQAKIAVLYSISMDKIINIGPLNN